MGSAHTNRGIGSTGINLAVLDYLLKRPVATISAALLIGTARFASGRDMLRGGRKTDATFLTPARRMRRGWWANLPGIARVATRVAVLVAMWAYAAHPVLLAVVAVAMAVWAVWRAVVGLRQRYYEKLWLRPVWPAVAHIIGVDDDESPSAWLDIPPDMSDPQAVIVVGLQTHTHDDDKRAQHLITLFSDRYGVEHVADVDHNRRVVYLARRLPDPAVWPALAAMIDVDPGEPSGQWLSVPQDLSSPEARVLVQLPEGITDDAATAVAVERLVNQRFRGEWRKHLDRDHRVVVLSPKLPPPEPPRYVDVATEHPHPQEAN